MSAGMKQAEETIREALNTLADLGNPTIKQLRAAAISALDEITNLTHVSMKPASDWAVELSNDWEHHGRSLNAAARMVGNIQADATAPLLARVKELETGLGGLLDSGLLTSEYGHLDSDERLIARVRAPLAHRGGGLRPSSLQRTTDDPRGLQAYCMSDRHRLN